MNTVVRGYNPRKPYAMLMKGRPDEPESWSSIAVYSREEEVVYKYDGWKPAKEFMNSADRARRGD